MTDLIIIGAGGSGRQLAEALEEMGDQFQLAGYLDDEKQGKKLNGVPVLGKIADIGSYLSCHFVVILEPVLKKRITEHLKLIGARYATVIHPAARVSQDSVISQGSVVMPCATVMPNVSIGRHVKVDEHSHLSHDVQVGDYGTIANSVAIAGRVSIGEGAYVGANASIRQDAVVGEWSIVGMGSVVLNNIPANEVWAGNPARFIRKRGQ